jgi:protease-4
LVKLDGVIEYGSAAGAEPIMAALQAAFDDSASVAVVMQMNSPGGSPVQAAMIYDEINRLRTKHNKPIYAVVEEVCASGCYYAAAAVDEIYVNQSSMVGSIGVLIDGFGVPELMKKLGVERRLYTAGSNKGMLDPFSPSTAKQTAIINSMLKDVHEQFKNAVKEGRGDSLEDDPELFSGRIYSGSQGVALGLADGYASVNSLARDVIKVENIVDYSPKENIAERVAKKLGASFGAGAMQSILKTADFRSIQ